MKGFVFIFCFTFIAFATLHIRDSAYESFTYQFFEIYLEIKWKIDVAMRISDEMI